MKALCTTEGYMHRVHITGICSLERDQTQKHGEIKKIQLSEEERSGMSEIAHS